MLVAGCIPVKNVEKAWKASKADNALADAQGFSNVGEAGATLGDLLGSKLGAGEKESE